MLPQPILVGPNEDSLVPRADLIFCLCCVCLNEVNWRHVDASYQLTASCCTLTFRAWPANKKMAVYRLECRPVNMKAGNVYWLHRADAIEPSPTFDLE